MKIILEHDNESAVLFDGDVGDEIDVTAMAIVKDGGFEYKIEILISMWVTDER